ncbi:MAG: ATP-binding protein, partial [Halochromatium sp.]
MRTFEAIKKDREGTLGEQRPFRTDEARLELAQAGRPWAFDAEGAGFKLGLEAYRISQAALFDPMMAVHASNVEPLPHQIAAVYEAMLPKQPLRFVLADDPGAGKTIMAGLLIRELLMRADARRILIVAPGGLTEQWQDELLEKFSLRFELFSREQQEQCASGNVFDEQDRLICRLDQLSRNEDVQAKLRTTDWDLIVVDEAHKLSATYFGNKVAKTKRFQLGELLGRITRHFLLMTATPHNGKEADFQLWLSLLDSDRFYGKFREGAHQVDVSDLMRRMVKEDLLKFDGTPLFPERRAYTANYPLSALEASLYEQVTTYVREEMNRADKLDGKTRNTVGFALTQLQRRLASSPEAIDQSLKRRRKRLEARLGEEKLGLRAQEEEKLELPDDLDDELSAEDYERFADRVADLAARAAVVEADPALLQNAVLNLCLNARDAMQQGGQIRIETADVVLDARNCAELPFAIEPGPYLRLQVIDTGTGMPSSVAEHIFDPFFTTKAPGQGTGLGLASVRETIVEHHGAIQVASTLGTGSCFTIFIPATGVLPDAPQTPATDAPGGGCVLVVDDDPTTRDVTAELLRT